MYQTAPAVKAPHTTFPPVIVCVCMPLLLWHQCIQRQLLHYYQRPLAHHSLAAGVLCQSTPLPEGRGGERTMPTLPSRSTRRLTAVSPQPFFCVFSQNPGSCPRNAAVALSFLRSQLHVWVTTRWPGPVAALSNASRNAIFRRRKEARSRCLSKQNRLGDFAKRKLVVQVAQPRRGNPGGPTSSSWWSKHGMVVTILRLGITMVLSFYMTQLKMVHFLKHTHNIPHS